MTVPAKRRRVPPYFTGLLPEVPEEVHFPGVGKLCHFNLATRKEGQNIRLAVAQSLDSLPEGVSTVVLLGSNRNPENNSEIAVFIDS